MGSVNIPLSEVVEEGGRLIAEYELEEVEHGSVKLEIQLLLPFVRGNGFRSEFARHFSDKNINPISNN